MSLGDYLGELALARSCDFLDEGWNYDEDALIRQFNFSVQEAANVTAVILELVDYKPSLFKHCDQTAALVLLTRTYADLYYFIKSEGYVK